MSVPQYSPCILLCFMSIINKDGKNVFYDISLQFLIEIARQKNRHPLPQIQTKSGLRLPPDRYCLTSTNYKVKAQKKVSA